MLFRNTYRIPSARRPGWDYANEGFYFVTICTRNRVCYFGEILNARVALSDIGNLVERMWLEIEQQFPFVQLDDFVVMPNHIHGILRIETQKKMSGDATDHVFAGGVTGDKNPMVKNDLSTAIRWFKGRVTFEANRTERKMPFAWQTRFHDRIVRTEAELWATREYIKNNPSNWLDDDQNTP